jgi:hypothetical protein
LDVVRKIVNGQPKIEYSNPKRQFESDGYTLVEPRNRGYKSRHKVTGSAISGIKSLRAISRPYSYYVGQWCMNTTPDILKKHINNFAKVIEIVELSTHLANRHFRAFKVTVESFCADAMLTGSNWPGGVRVERWYKRTKKDEENRYVNKVVTSSRSINRNNDVNTNVGPSNNDQETQLPVENSDDTSETESDDESVNMESDNDLENVNDHNEKFSNIN